MTSFDHHFEQLMQDPEFARLEREAEAELELALKTAAVRETRGMTQTQLAAAAGMRQPAIARFEKAGRTPTVTTLWRLATALNAVFVIGPGYAVQVLPVAASGGTVTFVHLPVPPTGAGGVGMPRGVGPSTGVDTLVTYRIGSSTEGARLHGPAVTSPLETERLLEVA
jgi:HTH-type transcriptional regulator/antitoxin HipB